MSYEFAKDLFNDPSFDAVMDDIIKDTLDEAHIMEGQINSPSIMRLCATLASQVPDIEAGLREQFPDEGGDNPDAFLPEAVTAIVQLAWDHGFRAGRIFQARGHEVGL
jgi:hypothetical protein